MESIKGYLTVLLVAAALCIPCSSYCIDHYSVSDCSRWYREVEKALLASETNKYQLHEEFFPSSQLSPIYGSVIYHIVGNDYYYCSGYYEWSSSALFAYIPPYTLTDTMLELLTVVLSIIKVPTKDYDIIQAFIKQSKSDSVVQLDLSLNLTTVTVINDALCAAIRDLTSWLKVYASTQKSQGSWNQQDYQYKGYSATLFHFTGSIVLSVIQLLVSVFTMTLFIRFTPTLYQKAALQAESWVSFYWASSLVTGLCNIAIIVCEVYRFIKIPVYGIGMFLIIKVVCLAVFFSFDFLFALCINKSSALQPPRIIRGVFCICCPCFCCSANCHLRLIQTVALWNILAFVHFTTWTTFPIILYTFVFPLQTLSVLALCATTIFCMITLVALFIRKSSMGLNRNSCKENCQIFLPLIMILTFLALIILIAAMYLFINTGQRVNSISGFIATFFPSAILTITGWFVTKGKFFNQPRTRTSHGREAEMAEEGVGTSSTGSQYPETLAQTVSETSPLLN